jgi:two-component system, chemotaxis family, protein-glutamate methylesterase/glutaminase
MMPDPSKARCCDVVVVAASAGGVEALIALVSGLPAQLPAAVFVVLHVPETRPSLLPDILSRRGALPAAPARDGERIRPGHIYTAMPGQHLTLERGHMRLSAGPRENGHRPSADVLFRTAAVAYGSRVTGIVLSGADDDGAAGLAVIKRLGGVAIVQDPDEALYARMPQSSLDAVAVDYCLAVADIARVVAELAPARSTVGRETAPEAGHMRQNDESQREPREVEAVEGQYRQRTPAAYTCPECHGTLWEVDEGGLVRFRCRVGHAFSGDNLLSGQAENVESALWMALRTLEERIQLSVQLAERARGRGLDRAAQRFEETTAEAKAGAEALRALLLNDKPAVLAASAEPVQSENLMSVS